MVRRILPRDMEQQLLKVASAESIDLTADGAEEDETEVRGYQQEKGWTILLIDARMGRMIDPEDETAGRYVYAL